MIEMLTTCVNGEARPLDYFSLKRLILSRLDQAPHIFQLTDSSGGSAGLLDELGPFVEDINREQSVFPLIVLVLSENAQLILRSDSFDTCPSMPTGSILDARELDPDALWGRYLHSRAAWECAGDLAQVRMYGLAWKELRPRDEQALEISCFAMATERWECVGESTKTELNGFLKDSSHPSKREEQSERLSRLIGGGVLWQAPGHSQPMPTAWVVRATAKSIVGNGILQRAALVNIYLVAEVLAWCFQLEALEKERYLDGSGLGEDLETKDQYDNFVNKNPNSAAHFYPESYPLELTSRDFEAFGKFCNRFSKNPRTSPRKRLLNIRNALCHGHYAGWRVIEDLLLVQAQLTATH
jgi:hypothetical protein